jgi:biotin transporter BioY|tara:strand:- start:153 stop:707 length:555 start_codon:yes stop_codon:yes gene_type:complete
MKFKSNISIADQYTSTKIFKIIFFILGIVLLTASSKYKIPFYPVPATLQTFVVLFMASTMGIIGFYSVLSYFILGLIGLPIFSMGGGISYILLPSFGYLVGMVLGSYLIAHMSKNLFNKSFLKLTSAIFLGTFIIFFCGILHMSVFLNFGLKASIVGGLIPFIYSELLKIALAISLSYILIKKN